MEECGSPYEQYQEVIAKIVIPRDEYCHRTDGYSATCDFFRGVKGRKFQGHEEDFAYCRLLSIKGVPAKVPNKEGSPPGFNFAKPKECLALEVVPKKDYSKDWRIKMNAEKNKHYTTWGSVDWALMKRRKQEFEDAKQ